MARKQIRPTAYDDAPQTKPASPEPDISPLVLRGKADWNARAQRDPLHWTVNAMPEGKWNLQEYMGYGEGTVVTSLDQYTMNGAIAFGHPSLVVELGSGAGRISQALAKRFDKVIGVDISSEMIKAARANMEILGVSNAEFREGNGYNLDCVASGIADCFYSAITLQHIPDQAAQLGYVREASRVLKPLGTFAISFYDNWAEYLVLKAEWEKRRIAGNVGDWSDLAKIELPRYETSMSNPVDNAALQAVLKEVGLIVVVDRGANSSVRWLMGYKEA